MLAGFFRVETWIEKFEPPPVEEKIPITPPSPSP
jgi:hypothetical protein